MTGSPGSDPHADRPNWRPAETFAEYLRNCQEGLEVYSDRRMAKLLGVSRVELWRWQRMSELPDELFERLLAHFKAENPRRPLPSSKTFAQISVALSRVADGGGKIADVETCPHCGGMLRTRRWISAEVARIVLDWLHEQKDRDIARDDETR